MDNEKVKKQVEEKIEKIINDGIQAENLDFLYKLVDIHKDLENEKYWKEKKEVMKMNYRGYGEYGNYSEGNYNEGSYGRRGVPGTGRGRYREGYGRNYRGQEMLEEMKEHYGNYSEGKEQMVQGNYGAEGTTMKALEYMLMSVEEFMNHLKSDANSQEEVEMIRKTARKISEM